MRQKRYVEIFVLVLVVTVIIIVVMNMSKSNTNPTFTIEMDNQIEQFNAEEISDELLKKLNIENDHHLYYVNHLAGPLRIDFLRDGTIQHFYWEMAILNENSFYEIYRATKDKSKLSVEKIDEVYEKDTQWGSVFDALKIIEKIPWQTLIRNLPKGDKYTAQITNVYKSGQRVAQSSKPINDKNNKNIKFLNEQYGHHVQLYLFENGNLFNVTNEILRINETSYEIAFSVTEKKSPRLYRGRVEGVLLIPTNTFKQ